MKSSVIIPCHPRNLKTLQRTLQSLDAAARGIEVEKIVIEDPESRGLSWARNCGLDRATGDVVFFCDADDTVRPGFFTRHIELLVGSGADFVLSSTRYAPLKRSYDLVGNRAIREVMMPAFFGYGFEDVRRWNRGGSLMERREQGGVWRCAFRREFLVRHGLRFDERLRLFEDSPFIAECACRAERVSSTDEVLYEYAPGVGGLLDGVVGTERYWQYKGVALESRKSIAERVGQDAMEWFRASAVFTVLEMMRARRNWRGYASDPFVRESMRGFPVSWRHPLVAMALAMARLAG